MSKNVLVNINMNGNEVQNVVMQNLATAPSNPKLGQFYYNTGDKKAYQWNGTAWKSFASELVVDSALSSTSTNPVQNKVINSALGNKVDKVSGKGLSTNDYTTAEKQQLANLVAGTITVDSALSASSTNPVQNKVINTALGNKVDKVSGKGLSTNDYTTTEKTKLSGIAEGANKTVVDSALSSSSTNPVQNKVVNTALGNKVDTSNVVSEVSSANGTKIPQVSAVMSYISTQLGNLPKEQFLDLAKTTFVQSFTWSSTTYPGSTNPNLNGKPVLVLALKNSSDNTVSYSFLNMYNLVDTYTAGDDVIQINDHKIYHASQNDLSSGHYGLASNATPSWGSSFGTPYFNVNIEGHIESAGSHTVRIPDSVATQTAAGLMSAADKTELDRLKALHGLTKTITAGETSVGESIAVENGVDVEILGYTAQLLSTGEEVLVEMECVKGSSWNVLTFSIAEPISEDILISCSYAQ